MINSDNSIQVNIKFTFTVFEYIIVYKIVYEISVFSTLSEHTHTHDGHTGFTFKWFFPAGFTWSFSLV